MAAVYNIKIKTVSAFQNYPPDQVKKILENLINEYRDEKTGLGFECTVVDVERE